MTHPPATQLPRGPGPGQAPPPSQDLGGSLPSHAGTSWACTSPESLSQQTDSSGQLRYGLLSAGLGFRRAGEAGVEMGTLVSR